LFYWEQTAEYWTLTNKPEEELDENNESHGNILEFKGYCISQTLSQEYCCLSLLAEKQRRRNDILDARMHVAQTDWSNESPSRARMEAWNWTLLLK
jgi:hypothetical protein